MDFNDSDMFAQSSYFNLHLKVLRIYSDPLKKTAWLYTLIIQFWVLGLQ